MSDTSDTTGAEPHHPFRPVSELIVSLRFLTRVPIPFARTVAPVSLAQAMRLFGVAGALIGAATGSFLWAFSLLHLPAPMGAVFAIAASLLLTGAMHEDGLSDTADGLGGGATRERRLEIMRDSRIGTYGTLALGVLLLARAGAYEGLSAFGHLHMVLILAASGAFSRAMVVDMMWATKAARSDGLAAAAGRPSRNTALIAICSGGVLAVYAGWAISPVVGIEAMAAALLVTSGIRRAAMRLIGGQTGDICGATQTLAELAMLACYLSTIH